MSQAGWNNVIYPSISIYLHAGVGRGWTRERPGPARGLVQSASLHLISRYELLAKGLKVGRVSLSGVQLSHCGVRHDLLLGFQYFRLIRNSSLPDAESATRSAFRIWQGMSWQHLHQPVGLERCSQNRRVCLCHL